MNLRKALEEIKNKKIGEKISFEEKMLGYKDFSFVGYLSKNKNKNQIYFLNGTFNKKVLNFFKKSNIFFKNDIYFENGTLQSFQFLKEETLNKFSKLDLTKFGFEKDINNFEDIELPIFGIFNEKKIHHDFVIPDIKITDSMKTEFTYRLSKQEDKIKDFFGYIDSLKNGTVQNDYPLVKLFKDSLFDNMSYLESSNHLWSIEIEEDFYYGLPIFNLENIPILNRALFPSFKELVAKVYHVDLKAVSFICLDKKLFVYILGENGMFSILNVTKQFSLKFNINQDYKRMDKYFIQEHAFKSLNPFQFINVYKDLLKVHFEETKEEYVFHSNANKFKMSAKKDSAYGMFVLKSELGEEKIFLNFYSMDELDFFVSRFFPNFKSDMTKYKTLSQKSFEKFLLIYSNGLEEQFEKETDFHGNVTYKTIHGKIPFSLYFENGHLKYIKGFPVLNYGIIYLYSVQDLTRFLRCLPNLYIFDIKK